jgi:hypothetical protein
MNKVAMAIVIATVLVSCNSPSDVVKSTSLREEVINAGPERLISTLQSYPQTNGEMIRTKGDHQFLVEIFAWNCDAAGLVERFCERFC